MAIKKNTTDLFRFVTLRGPQLVDETRKHLGFVFHPDSTSSHFLSVITNGTVEEARIEVEAQIDSFTSIPSIANVKNLDNDLWDFSNQLMKNKNRIDEVDVNLTLPALPNSSTLLVLWDNVFYDILTKQNRAVRQACLQMIVAANYIEKLSDAVLISDTSIEEVIKTPRKPEGIELIEKRAIFNKRIANAKIVLHPAFTFLKLVTNSLTTGVNANKNYSNQQGLHAALTAKHYVSTVKSILEEIEEFSEVYNDEKQSDYKKEYDKHTITIKNAEDSFINNNSELKTLYKNNELNLEFDKDAYIPDDLVDSFEHVFPKPFSADYTGVKSQQLADYIETKNFSNKELTEAKNSTEKLLSDLKKLDYKYQTKKSGIALINGVKVKTQPLNLFDFSLSFENYFNKTVGGNNSAFLSVVFDKQNAFAVSANYSIEIDGNSPVALTTISTITSKGNAVLFKIFDDSSLNLTNDSQFIFQGEFTLNDGRTYSIEPIQGNISNLITSGSGSINSESASEVLHYGINKIGVADYRRVEQELCCYIPGEVSHIENVMAKEYKEKSTRSLTRTQSVTELINERETEELTDTVTTSRFEMSSEVADVLTKDRSFGAQVSAGAQKKGTVLDVQGSFAADFAISRSTSNSNTEAQTYAEDVTKRALERIVQKISLRRTSTIIREYEENVRHGFDNTGDDAQHVTGVYRWVDKEYTNRLVNYGKRLIYEFMIPEPARYYKRAVILESDNETNGTPNGGSTGSGTGVNQMPIHPRDLEDGMAVKNFEDITRDNYSAIAAIYDASVEAPIDLDKTFSKSVSGTADDRNEHEYSSELNITEDYECYKLDINGSISHYKNGVYLKVSSGGVTVNKNMGNGGTSTDWATGNSIDKVNGLLGIKINTKKVKSFNLSLRYLCSIKDSTYNQWKIDTYDSIMAAYDQKVQEFTAAEALAQSEIIANGQEQDDSIIKGNSRFNQQVVLTELKRLCIESLMAPFGHIQGKNFYKEGKCNVPVLPNEKTLRDYAEQVKFFEQAYQWDLFAAKFYPYYWASRCDWKDLFQSTDSLDHIFQAFLQSGMAKIMIPVKPGFEDAVVYYMETGEVWTGNGMVFNTDDDLYLSLVDEMQDVEGWVEKEWKTIVPTSLTLLQARSVALDVGGLPCCSSDQEEIDELNLNEDTNVLSVKNEVINP